MTRTTKYVCEVCGKACKTQQALSTHRSFKHGLRATREGEERQLYADADFTKLFALFEGGESPIEAVKQGICSPDVANEAFKRFSEMREAEKLGLLRDEPKSSDHAEDDFLTDAIKKGVKEGVKEGRKGLNVDSEVISKPIGEALSNMAQTTGLLNRFINRVVITSFEQEALTNPRFRKQIVEKAGFFLDMAKREGGTEEEIDEKGEGEASGGIKNMETMVQLFGTKGEGKSEEEKKGIKETGRKEIIGALNEYFEDESP